MEAEDLTTEEPIEAPPTDTTEVVEEPERRNPAEERIAEQAAEIRRLRESLEMTQQMQREQLARSTPGDPKLQEYADHPYTQFVARQVQAATLPILDQTDRLRAELAISKKYGEDVWEQIEADVEREHQAYLQRGQWAERDKLAYLVAGQKGMKLEPKAERQRHEQRTVRAKSARAAGVETATPVRRADSTPAPPLHTMEKSKRDAALAEYIRQQGGI